MRLKRLKNTGVTNSELKGRASLKLFNGYFLFYLNYQKVTAQFFKILILFTSISQFFKLKSAQNILPPFCCVLRKDTLWYFSLLGGLCKQF